MWKVLLKQDYSYEWIGIVDGRPIMIVDVEGEKILFYKRTGSGGADNEGVKEEDQIKAGQFAPFYGFRYDGWFIKPQGSRAGKYLKVARWLNNNAIKNWPRKELDIFKFNREMKERGAVLTNGIHIAQTEPLLIVRNNIEEIKIKVNKAFKSIDTIQVKARHPKEHESMKKFHKRINKTGYKVHPQDYYVFDKKEQYEQYKRMEAKVNDHLSAFEDRFDTVSQDESISLKLEHTLKER